jgi:uncharacterized protein with FMN-binding domain
MLEAEERRPQMPRPGSTDRTPIPATPDAPVVQPHVAAAPAARDGAQRAPHDVVQGLSPANADAATPRAAMKSSSPAPQGVASATPAVPASSGIGSANIAPSVDVPALPAAASAPQAAPAAQAAALTAIANVAMAAQEGGASPAAPATPAALKWKDGRYTGWGTCRHGDLQATIQIENGRIVTSSISQCLTRYPCDWIRPLPPQVIQRQSAEVDFISGATESTNAFYYAVLQALGKAAQ